MAFGADDVPIKPSTSPVELLNGFTLASLIGESTQGLHVHYLTFAGAQYEATVNRHNLWPRSALYVARATATIRAKIKALFCIR